MHIGLTLDVYMNPDASPFKEMSDTDKPLALH